MDLPRPAVPPHDRRDDAQLAGAAAGGDRAALEALLARHQQLVYRVCRRLCDSDADALDATQEALLTVVRRIGRFDGRSAFTTWLYRVATNACLDELRRKRRRPTPAVVDEQARPSLAGPLAADPDVHGADRLDIEAALTRLPPEFRAAVVLRDIAGLDYAQIAAVLDVAPGTVRSRIARGRARLADLLDGNRAGAGQRPTTHDAPTDLPSP